MTDGFDQALIDAGLALLRADTGLAVYEGPVPNPTPPLPYVVVWTTVEWPADKPDFDSLDNLSKHAVVRWYCHCVGGNDKAAIAVGQRCRTQLLNVRPTVTGMNCGLITMEYGSTAPEPNEITGSPTVTAVRTFALTANI